MEEEKKKEKLISLKALFQYLSSDVDKIAEGEALVAVNSEKIIISQQKMGNLKLQRNPQRKIPIKVKIKCRLKRGKQNLK